MGQQEDNDLVVLLLGLGILAICAYAIYCTLMQPF